MKKLIWLLLLFASPCFANGYVGANGLTSFNYLTTFTATRTLSSASDGVIIVIQGHATGWTCAGMTAGSSDTTNGVDYAYYVTNAGTTSFSSVCNGAASSQNTTYDVIEFTSGLSYDTGACNSGASGASVTISTAAANDFLVAVISDGASSTLSSPLVQITSQSYVVDGYDNPASSGSQTYNATVSSGYNMCADAFKSGGGGGTSAPPTQQMMGVGDMAASFSPNGLISVDLTALLSASVQCGTTCTHWVDVCGTDDSGNPVCLQVGPKLDLYQVDSIPATTTAAAGMVKTFIGQVTTMLNPVTVGPTTGFVP